MRMKRWLLRLLGIGVLVAASYVAFHTARAWPRCVITSDSHILHFSHDGGTILTGYSGIGIGSVRTSREVKPPIHVWDTRSGEVLRTLLHDVAPFERYALCAGRALLAANTGRGVVRVADWQTGVEFEVVVGGGEVGRLDFSPRGDLLAAYAEGHDEPFVLIDLADKAVIQRWREGLRSPHFSRDGRFWHFIANGRAQAWNTATRRVEASRPIEGWLQKSKDGRVFVGWSSDDLCLIACDSETLRPHARFRPSMVKERAGKPPTGRDVMNSMSVVVSPSGRWIVTLPGQPAQHRHGITGPLELWDGTTGRRIAALPPLNPALAWFPDDGTLCHFDWNQAQVIDPATGRIRWEMDATGGNLHLIDSRTAVHPTLEGRWDIFDVKTGQLRRSLPHSFLPMREKCFISFSADKRRCCGFGPRRPPAFLTLWPKWLPSGFAADAGAVQVIDLENDRSLLHLHFDELVGGVLSGDGDTLVCYDLRNVAGVGSRKTPASEHVFRFYDLDSRKPWFWAAAAPTALLGLAWSWRRWRGWRKTTIR